MPRIFIPGMETKDRTVLRNYREPTEQQAKEMCCAFATVLTTMYPGHLWEVGMMGNLVYIKNLRLNAAMGYKIPVHEIDVEGKVLMRIGGEILERFNQRRGKVDVKNIKSLKRNVRGDAVPQI